MVSFIHLIMSHQVLSSFKSEDEWSSSPVIHSVMSLIQLMPAADFPAGLPNIQIEN